MSVFKEPTTHKTPALDVTHVQPSARRVLRAQHPTEARGDAAPKNILIAAGAVRQIPVHTFPTSGQSTVVIFN